MTKYVSTSNAGKRRHLHTDPECPRLTNAERVREARDTDTYPACEWCHDGVDNSGPQHTASYQALRDADPEDLDA